MNPPHKHRVLGVDDDSLVRDAYRAFFAQQPDFDLVGEARDGREAEEVYARVRPDVVLMDLQMPITAGIEATRAICHRWPGACIVAMTTFTTREYVVAALRAGASGYVVKGASGPQLLAALRQALAGDMPLSSGVRRELVSSLVEEGPDGLPAREHGLTPREVELVHWLAHGLTNSQIARRMNVSEGSIKQYVARVSEKLGVASRTQVLVRVIQLGIVDPQALPPIST